MTHTEMKVDEIAEIAKPMVGKTLGVIRSASHFDDAEQIIEIVPPVLDIGDRLLFFIVDPKQGIEHPLISWPSDEIESLREFSGEVQIELLYKGRHWSGERFSQS